MKIKGVLNRNKWALMVLVFLILGLGACGNKGDLYLPKEAEAQKAAEQNKEEPKKPEKSIE